MALNIIQNFEEKLINKIHYPKNIYSMKETRFILFGPQIYQKLKDLNENSFYKNNLLFTPWHIYGRDLRIKNIFDKLRLVKEKTLIS